ncbi:MAG: ArsR family transcriptional regulator [Candidatus Nanohalobium sp.]
MNQETLSYEEASDRVEDLNPSAKLAYYILKRECSEMSKTDLEEETLLEDRTLREAMNALEEQGVAYKRKNPHDHKKRLYGLNIEEFETPGYTSLE